MTPEGEEISLTPLCKVPESQEWLPTPEMREKLARAKQWCRENPPAETRLDDLLALVKDRL